MASCRVGGTRQHGRIGHCRAGERRVGHDRAGDGVGAGGIAGAGRLVIGRTGYAPAGHGHTVEAVSRRGTHGTQPRRESPQRGGCRVSRGMTVRAVVACWVAAWGHPAHGAESSTSRTAQKWRLEQQLNLSAHFFLPPLVLTASCLILSRCQPWRRQCRCLSPLALSSASTPRPPRPRPGPCRGTPVRCPDSCDLRRPATRLLGLVPRDRVCIIRRLASPLPPLVRP